MLGCVTPSGTGTQFTVDLPLLFSNVFSVSCQVWQYLWARPTAMNPPSLTTRWWWTKVKTKKDQRRMNVRPNTWMKRLRGARVRSCHLCQIQRERDLARTRPWRQQVVFLKILRRFQKEMVSRPWSP